MNVDLILNGRGTTLDVRSDEMLLDVLRREGLRSVRETCGIGVCGALHGAARRRAGHRAA